MGKHREHLINDMALMPGRVVDDQHDPGVGCGRIGTGNIPEVFGKSLLQVPPFRYRGCPPLPWARHQPCRQMAGDEVEGAIRHWFSLMGTFLPFAIITYAICIWKISCTDSRLSRMPKATAGTSRIVKWTRRKLCITQYTRNSLCNPVVALAYILVFLRKGAHLRRRALKNASA